MPIQTCKQRRAAGVASPPTPHTPPTSPRNRRTATKPTMEASLDPPVITPPARHSPDWDIPSGGFPTPDEERLSPFVPSDSGSRESSPEAEAEGMSGSEDDDEQLSSDRGVPTTAVSNARSPRWLPWQDRALVQSIDVVRPFEADRGDDTAQAWQRVAVELFTATTANGTAVNRTSEACRGRFRLILKAHRKQQTRAKQLTGAVEDVDEHVKLLDDIVDFLDGQQTSKVKKTSAARTKAAVEDVGGKEMRDAAMRGLVRGSGLTDVAKLEGSTIREKQGQRRALKRRHAADDDSDKENNSAGSGNDCDRSVAPKRRRRNQLMEMLDNRVEHDTKLLKDAQAVDERRHKQNLKYQEKSLALQEKVAGGMDMLARAQAQMLDMQRRNAEDEIQRRQEETERRLADAERTNMMLMAMMKKSAD
ncbi:Myb-like domain-containing protein [Mycena indigotica]|uniref:Myb-like domain-containing protein n=1 Tax=Mycena indigotica TaxID=2126181 RepID=A0A8H6S3R8_9AGAR|nr:Myb-like domain-containing protein [Mycena indigotica]KAF7292640.1 Myb-like domain-containing protein [Mycena indigotica]